VFDLATEESDRVDALRDRIHRALAAHSAISPMEVALLAAYMPLDCLPAAELLKRSWPAEVADLLELQVSTPAAERQLRASIPQLTPIADDMSVRVRDQYENNPFPRWVKLPASPPMAFDEWMPRYFPFSRFRRIGKGDNLDVLIGGCGTGHQSIVLAQTLPSARILAVDLSMSSLCYAKEKTRAAGISNIEYAQADILELGNLARRFDIISSSGVLHHTADPEKGWRTLLRLLRPGGCMQIGLYSERAHRHVFAVQRWLSAHGFSTSVADIRRARQELADAAKTDAALANALSFSVFFSTSEFRDLFRPTEMHRFTIPRIRNFLDENDLEFIGFVITNEIRQQFWRRFSQQAEADLDLWDQFEAAYPDAFKGMYEFWVQKKRAA
jgi:ubiquinone/menaquinone biosynthesis C-methylase UbiE